MGRFSATLRGNRLAEPIHFPEADDIEDFAPPHPSRPLPVKVFPKSTLSCWLLSVAEQEEVARTGVIWLTTRTFRSLEERPDGARFQPEVLVQTSRADALAGWGDIVAAPAADRVVSFQDNQPAIDEAREALKTLADHLRDSNDHGELTTAEIEEAAREVMILEHAFACEALRVDWIMTIATKSLRWIADKAAGALIGRLAIDALIAIAKAVGRSI